MIIVNYNQAQPIKQAIEKKKNIYVHHTCYTLLDFHGWLPLLLRRDPKTDLSVLLIHVWMVDGCLELHLQHIQNEQINMKTKNEARKRLKYKAT